MDVHVDHAGEQSLTGKIDVPYLSAPAERPRIADRSDAPIVVHEDGRMIDIFAGQHVKISIGGDNRRGVSGCCGQQ